jgi:hypothetical protein
MQTAGKVCNSTVVGNDANFSPGNFSFTPKSFDVG